MLTRSLSRFRTVSPAARLACSTLGQHNPFRFASTVIEDNLKSARATAREMQGKVKTEYAKSPELAKSLAHASCSVPGFVTAMEDQSPHCFVDRQVMHRTIGDSHIMGLAPSTGGNDTYGCSADMLLQALLGCTGTTLRAVASARGAIFDRCVIDAEGDYDARGTLGVEKSVPIGVTAIRLKFKFEVGQSVAAGHVLGSADWERVLATTEKYCVVAQSISKGLEKGIEISYTIDHGQNSKTQ